VDNQNAADGAVSDELGFTAGQWVLEYDSKTVTSA
jgi:hypothetical protein